MLYEKPFDYLVKLSAHKPSILVIDGLHQYKDLRISPKISVYATMQAESIEEARKQINDKDIQIEFHNFIVMKNHQAMYYQQPSKHYAN